MKRSDRARHLRNEIRKISERIEELGEIAESPEYEFVCNDDPDIESRDRSEFGVLLKDGVMPIFFCNEAARRLYEANPEDRRNIMPLPEYIERLLPRDLRQLKNKRDGLQEELDKLRQAAVKKPEPVVTEEPVETPIVVATRAEEDRAAERAQVAVAPKKAPQPPAEIVLESSESGRHRNRKGRNGAKRPEEESSGNHQTH